MSWTPFKKSVCSGFLAQGIITLEPHYPTLDPQVLRTLTLIQKLSDQDPTYLKKAPYPIEIVDFFPKKSESFTVAVKSDETRDLEEEADILYNDLKALRPSMIGGNESSKDSFDYVKAATSLLEKVLNIKERASKIKEIDKFKATVIEFLADVVTPEQRTLFMDALSRANI